MNIFFYTVLFILGTLFGSFASVVIYRIRSGEGGICGGRSHCKTCDRNLSVRELVPIFSWMFQGGTCSGCQQKISYVYPILELVMGVLFLVAGYFLISPELIFMGNSFEIFKLIYFLSIIFFTVIYVFYDILYLEIPESILLNLNILILGGLSFEILSAGVFDSRLVLFDWLKYTNGGQYLALQLGLAGVIIGGLYTIMRAGLREIYDIGILLWLWGLLIFANNYFQSGFQNSVFQSPLIDGLYGALALFSFFFAQIVVSKGRWMGAGDLRIAIAMGLIVGIYFALPSGMITYITGSIVGIGIILFSKILHTKQKEIDHQIPFGPFLACGYLGVMFFHPQISAFIQQYF
ncbi:prepilin peptidase [Candidatus Gracilibacteria bacterium]|nr:prepilin peptidase [Candidatus Gracilibacteria bacterium]